MPAVLLDRYLVLQGVDACDLATGEIVRTDDLTAAEAPRPVLPAALIDVLDHGIDGEPRSLAVDVRSARGWRAAADGVAVEAVSRGYVPIAVDCYSRFAATVRTEFAERTLVLLASDRNLHTARRAFLDAASHSPRPHVLLTLRCGRSSPLQLREARASYAAGAARHAPGAVHPDVLQHLDRARRATEFISLGRHAAAERLLRDVWGALGRRSAWPQAIPIALALGRLLLERGRPLDACQVFSDAAARAAAVREDALDTQSRLWLATAKTEAAQLTAAESICRALIQTAALPRPFEAWTLAVLIRVLLWQERVHDALTLPPVDVDAAAMLDGDTRVFIQAMSSRLLLAAGRVFEAGLRVQSLMTASAGGSAAGLALTLAARLRWLAAAGDVQAAETALREIACVARRARTPLPVLRARLLWSALLQRAGRTREADRERRALARAARAVPPLLRMAIEQQQRSITGDAIERAGAGAADAAAASRDVSAASLVSIANEEEDDKIAVERLLCAVSRRIHATRVDVWSTDAGPASIVQSVGTGLGTTIGGRVLDAGLAIGPDGADPPYQVGVPVRLGSRLVAAAVAHWPADRVPPADAACALGLVAAVAAPRIDGLLHRARVESDAASLIPELVGVSRAMSDVRQAVSRAAAAPFAVLIEGESGVGKELIARAVHYLSPRRQRRFCDVNCAALPDELLESELFGHAKGAFTGAIVDKTGLFEEAHGGTLFLDEVADLSPRAQAKLLRALQQQEIRRIGETFARPVDVRLVAAANRDVRAEVAAGRFRQDLLYRLEVIRLPVPPLRERPEDIPLLAQHFWTTAASRVGTIASLTPAVLTALTAYPWPGNVRELQNVVAALAVAAPRRGRVTAGLLPPAITRATPLRTARLAEARRQFERRFVEVALAQAAGNRARAARTLGLSRQGLLKLMERLHVDADVAPK